MGKKETNKLLYAPANGYDHLDAAEEKLMQDYCEAYKTFLNNGKTERLCVDYCIELAEARGFKEYESGMALKAGEEKQVAVKLDKNAFTVVNDEGERIADGKVFDLYCGLSQPDALSVELTGQAPIKTTVTFE